MKKIISSLMIVVILFNFILNSSCVYATDAETTSEGIEKFSGVTEETISPEDTMKIVYDGNVNGISFQWNILGEIFGTIAGILALVVNIFPTVIEIGMMIITSQTEFVTIENVVFNRVGLFNINYFNFKKTYEVNDEKIEIPKIVINLKESVARSFYILRLLSIALSLIILIYVGIRMALSTVSQDKAKYKKMLMGWLESIIILFTLQYIISAIFILGDSLLDIICGLKNDLYPNETASFENKIIDDLTSFMLGSSGWEYALNSVSYWFLMFVQTKFFLGYFKRTIVVGFLVLIAPLITIIYPIDKIGDGKSQSFVVWLNELIVNVIIQPIHALIYLVFMFIAGEIAKYSMIVGIIFLLSLTKIEKIILQMFNLKNVVSLARIDDQRKR